MDMVLLLSVVMAAYLKSGKRFSRAYPLLCVSHSMKLKRNIGGTHLCVSHSMNLKRNIGGIQYSLGLAGQMPKIYIVCSKLNLLRICGLHRLR
jgi:hypothetical protein